MATKIYRLLNSNAKTYVLQSEHKPKVPLQYYDAKEGIKRAIRYCTNYNTPFIDEQMKDGQDNKYYQAMVGRIIFKDGFLYVDETETGLLNFLDVTPHNGVIFELIDVKAKAIEELAEYEILDQAIEEYKKMSDENIPNIYSLFYDKEEEELAIMRSKVRSYIQNNPKKFMKTISTEDISMRKLVASYFDNGYLKKGRKTPQGITVRYNLTKPENKDVLCTVPPKNKDVIKYVMDYIESNDKARELINQEITQ
jgi:hypothetical protein